MICVDVTVFLSSITSAITESAISESFGGMICECVSKSAKQGKFGRSVISYHDLMVALSTVEPVFDEWVQLSTLWRKYLAGALSSGITVNSSNGEREAKWLKIGLVNVESTIGVIFVLRQKFDSLEEAESSLRNLDNTICELGPNDRWAVFDADDMEVILTYSPLSLQHMRFESD